MTHRERVLTALRHREPDRVPLFYRDEPDVERRLLRDLGLADREALLRHFGIDFRWVEPAYIGPCLWDEETGRKRDIWGVEYQHTKFSEDAGYWEAVTHPLAGVTDPARLKDYPWPSLDWFDFGAMADQVARFDEYVIMTSPGYASPGFLQNPIQTLVGMERGFLDIVINPEFFHALVRHILAFLEPFVDRMLEAAGGRVDLFRVGDDYGTQRGLMMSPDHWRGFIQPALGRLGAIAKARGASFYLHSCGAIRNLIPDFIETGVDVIDPLQVKAAGMRPDELKAEFGDRMCFCGGVDEQELLRNGTPDEVKSGVIELLDAIAPGGGFFIGPTHNFQVDIPTANIAALYEAARDWTY